MRRLTSILLLITVLGLGTGGLAYVHDLQHAAEDAREDRDAGAAGLPVEHHHHDESNCHVHAQLHLPLIAAGWATMVVSLGLLPASPPPVRSACPTRRPPAERTAGTRRCRRRSDTDPDWTASVTADVAPHVRAGRRGSPRL